MFLCRQAVNVGLVLADAATKAVSPPVGKERSGENGPNTNNDLLVQSIMEGIDQVLRECPSITYKLLKSCSEDSLRADNDTWLPQQGSLDAISLGDLEGQDPESIRASLRQANGDPAPAPANGAGNMSGMPRAFKDSELRRLEEEVRPESSPFLCTSFVLLYTPITRTLQGCLQPFAALVLCVHARGGHAGAAKKPAKTAAALRIHPCQQLRVHFSKTFELTLGSMNTEQRSCLA